MKKNSMQKAFDILALLAVLCVLIGLGCLAVMVATNDTGLGKFFVWPILGALGFIGAAMLCATIMDLRREPRA